MAHDRETFQKLAECRLREAELLASAGESSGAYYLAGYAIECALKAHIASQFHANEIPDRALVNRIYTHDLSELVKLAGLEAELKSEIEANAVLRRRWSTAAKWSEGSRYQVCTIDSASDMIDAVSGGDTGDGLLRWLISRSQTPK